jgi:hypothetical protein
MATTLKTSIDVRPLWRDEGEHWSDFMQREHDYEVRVLNEAIAAIKAKRPNDEHAGAIVRFPFADGHAQYVVVSSKPLKLQHIDIGDGWHARASDIRGFRITDLKSGG